jgi:hypothetical protein
MQIKGFGSTAADYDIRVENKRTGAGVRVTSDRPLVDLVYWTSPTNSSPEPYIHIRADRGADDFLATTPPFLTGDNLFRFDSTARNCQALNCSTSCALTRCQSLPASVSHPAQMPRSEW